MRNRNLLIVAVVVAAVAALAAAGYAWLRPSSGAGTAFGSLFGPKPFLDTLPAPVDHPLAQVQPDDLALGDPAAKVTMIEYFSFTCPHCATTALEVMPVLKERYIDTGKVRLAMRDYPFDPVAVQAAILAHCVPPMVYFNMSEQLFRTQREWAKENPLPELAALARLAGLDEAAFQACLADKALQDRILASVQKGNEAFGVAATPTFVVNGIVFSGERSVEEFSSLFDKLLAE